MKWGRICGHQGKNARLRRTRGCVSWDGSLPGRRFIDFSSFAFGGKCVIFKACLVTFKLPLCSFFPWGQQGALNTREAVAVGNRCLCHRWLLEILSVRIDENGRAGRSSSIHLSVLTLCEMNPPWRVRATCLSFSPPSPSVQFSALTAPRGRLMFIPTPALKE